MARYLPRFTLKIRLHHIKYIRFSSCPFVGGINALAGSINTPIRGCCLCGLNHGGQNDGAPCRLLKSRCRLGSRGEVPRPGLRFTTPPTHTHTPPLEMQVSSPRQSQLQSETHHQLLPTPCRRR